jgi:Phage derived protein Gp49-like (DUF891)
MAQELETRRSQEHRFRYQDCAVWLAVGNAIDSQAGTGFVGGPPRAHISQGIARVIFTVESQTMVLLHGFIKKSRKTPPGELHTARQRLADLRQE